MEILKTLRDLLISPSSPDPLDRLRIVMGGKTNILYVDLAQPPEGFPVGQTSNVVIARPSDAILTRFFQRNSSALAGKSFKKIAAHNAAYEEVGFQLRNLGGDDDCNVFQSDRAMRLRKGETVADDSLNLTDAYKAHIRRKANALEYQALAACRSEKPQPWPQRTSRRIRGQ